MRAATEPLITASLGWFLFSSLLLGVACELRMCPWLIKFAASHWDAVLNDLCAAVP
jgi:hypothetical protein